MDHKTRKWGGEYSRMLHHLSFAVSNLERCSAFYDAILAPLGYVRVWDDATTIGYGKAGGQDEFAIKLRTVRLSIPGDGFHVAFSGKSRRAIDAFYEAGLRHGGQDNGGTGIHSEYGPDYYAAFLIDPEGYRIEATLRQDS